MRLSMAACVMPSGPASAAAICGSCAAVISSGSANTWSVGTVSARTVPSAAVMSPRTAGSWTVCTRCWSASARYLDPSNPCSCTSRPANSESANATHSRLARRRRAGSPRFSATRRLDRGRRRGPGRPRDGREEPADSCPCPRGLARPAGSTTSRRSPSRGRPAPSRRPPARGPRRRSSPSGCGASRPPREALPSRGSPRRRAPRRPPSRGLALSGGPPPRPPRRPPVRRAPFCWSPRR